MSTTPQVKTRITGRTTKTLKFPFLLAQRGAVEDALPKIEEAIRALLVENVSSEEGIGIPVHIKLTLGEDPEEKRPVVAVMMAVKRLEQGGEATITAAEEPNAP